MQGATTARPDARPPPARANEEIGVDQLSLAVLVVDSELRLTYFNSAAAELPGLNHELGHLLSDSGPLGAALADTADRAVANEHSVIQRSVEAYRSGDREYYDAVFVPGVNPAGQPRVFIEIYPVAQRSQVDVSLQEVIQQSVTRGISRGLAHEIKNPLGGLRGAAQLLQASVSPELREYTEVMLSEVDRIARLIDGLQNRYSPQDYQSVNLHMVLDRVRQVVLAQYPRLRIPRDFDPSIPEIRGSLDGLTQGFLNLMINAAQAGASEICLRTRIRRGIALAGGAPTTAVAVEFIDDGPGVPEEIRDVIFYPLISGREGGSGLGLSIAQSIAVAHGGVIRLHHHEEATLFQWLIPLPS